MKVLQVELPEDLAAEIERRVKAGTFRDAEDAVVNALRSELSQRSNASRSTTSVSENPRAIAFECRARMIEDAWKKCSSGDAMSALTLEALVAAMRESAHSDLPSTSMYFAGADVDHPYFLKSDTLAIGIAVLPEDAEKARTRKRHPHQVEVIFVLSGGLHLFIEGKSVLTLKKDDHYVIGKNVCHWITPLENEPGAFLFVKTNPAQEPRGVSCGES